MKNQFNNTPIYFIEKFAVEPLIPGSFSAHQEPGYEAKLVHAAFWTRLTLLRTCINAYGRA